MGRFIESCTISIQPELSGITTFVANFYQVGESPPPCKTCISEYLCLETTNHGRITRVCVITFVARTANLHLTKKPCKRAQLFSAGPAALVPSTFSIERLEPVSLFPKTIKPALRPMFILLPQVCTLPTSCSDTNAQEACVASKEKISG
jgi:hypothetical protein